MSLSCSRIEISEDSVGWKRAEERDIRTRKQFGRQPVRVYVFYAHIFYTWTYSVHIAYGLFVHLLGGWWTRPSNWKSNTAIAFTGILTVAYGVFTVSADKEVCSLSGFSRERS